MKLNIVDMYSDILNVYGDIGNLLALKQRCNWRGIDTNITKFSKDKDIELDIENTDIILIGGESDQGQSIVSQHLLNQRNKLQEFIDNNGVILTICGSYQMFGNLYLDADKNKIPCLEILDIETKSDKNRLISNIVLENNIGLKPTTIVGFENHGGRTYHDYKTLGQVSVGFGNNEESDSEGLVYKNFIGTYLHGPILPKNPHITDKLILEALKRKYNIDFLEKLDNTIELKAHEQMVNRLLKK